jgi:predicted transcriptional regulator of viral defense system
MRANRLQRERTVGVVAARQHGLIARRQLVALGFGRGAIRRWLECGRLHRVHGGVYAIGHARLTARGRWIAGVLACGEGALLSHASAGVLWDLLPPRGAQIHVTVPRRGARRPRGVTLHATLHLPS